MDQNRTEYPRQACDTAARFRDAVEKTGCRHGATEPIAALTQRFESELDLDHAATELGMSALQLQKLFEKSATLARSMGLLAQEPRCFARGLRHDPVWQ